MKWYLAAQYRELSDDLENAIESKDLISLENVLDDFDDFIPENTRKEPEKKLIKEAKFLVKMLQAKEGNLGIYFFFIISQEKTLDIFWGLLQLFILADPTQQLRNKILEAIESNNMEEMEKAALAFEAKADPKKIRPKDLKLIEKIKKEKETRKLNQGLSNKSFV